MYSVYWFFQKDIGSEFIEEGNTFRKYLNQWFSSFQAPWGTEFTIYLITSNLTIVAIKLCDNSPAFMNRVGVYLCYSVWKWKETYPTASCY